MDRNGKQSQWKIKSADPGSYQFPKFPARMSPSNTPSTHCCSQKGMDLLTVLSHA